MSYDPTVFANSSGGGQEPNPYQQETAAAPYSSSSNPNNYSYNPYGQNQPPQQGGANTSYPPFEQYGAPPPPPNAGGNAYQPNNVPPWPNAGMNQYQQYPNAVPPMYNGAGGMAAPQAGGKRSAMGKIVLITLAALVILGGLGTVIAISARNNQIAADNTHATATASTQNVTATAQVKATATAQVYATATAIASTYPFSSNLKLDDPLTDNSRGNGWITDKGCKFAADGYHADEPNTKTYYTCPAMKANFSDFTYQVSVQVIKGEVAGITFRGDDTRVRYYSFILDQDGSYVLFLYKREGEKPVTLSEGSTSRFKSNQKNDIGVVARGSKISLYVNKYEVTTVTDSTFSSGQVGTIVYNLDGPVEAVFTDAKVWQL